MKEGAWASPSFFTSMNVYTVIKKKTDMAPDLYKNNSCEHFLQPRVPTGLLRGAYVSLSWPPICEPSDGLLCMLITWSHTLGTF